MTSILAKRVATALVLGGGLLAGIWFLDSDWLALLLGALMTIGAWEWAGFIPMRSIATRGVYALAMAAVIFATWRYGRGDLATQLILVGGLAWWTASAWWISGPRWQLPRSVKAVAGFLVLVPAWAALVRLHMVPTLGIWLFLYVFALVAAADVGAYFSGRWLGRTRLAPAVSPGKTWEGLAGGLLVGAILAVVSGILLNVDVAVFLGASVFVVLVSVVGDLTESILKRQVGIKDSGRILPGHGGIMDRIDSLVAAAPVFVLALYFTGGFRWSG